MNSIPGNSKKRLSALLLSLVFVVCCLPAAFAIDLKVDAGFYFKQSRGGTCTLTSAAMMLRRRAYLDGLDNWTNVTENSVRSSAWSGGLSHSFTYNAMHVGYGTLPSGTEAKTKALISLLEQHPEGIVLYDRTEPHAVLLTDYTNGVFYCSDPSTGISSGRVPLTDSMITLRDSSCYWYITSDSNSIASTTSTQSDSLRLEGMRYPTNIRTGKGMSMTGTACANTGAVLTEVEVSILNEADEVVQGASSTPNTESWSFKNMDDKIHFGELAEGTYTYVVLITDSTGKSLCFSNDFTVTTNASSTSTYWSVQDTSGSMLQEVQQVVQQTSDVITDTTESVTQTTEDAFSWLGSWLGL